MIATVMIGRVMLSRLEQVIIADNILGDARSPPPAHEDLDTAE